MHWPLLCWHSIVAQGYHQGDELKLFRSTFPSVLTHKAVVHFCACWLSQPGSKLVVRLQAHCNCNLLEAGVFVQVQLGAYRLEFLLYNK